MRIKHLTAYLNPNSSPNGISGGHSKRKDKPEVFAGKVHSNKDYNYRPAKSVSFSGSAAINTSKIVGDAISELAENGVMKIGNSKLKIKKAPDWIVNFLQSKRVNSALKLVKDNEALFENIVTLGLAGLLKPICVLLMPGTEEKDKQANATKNFVAAITGFILTTAILTPISKGVRKVTNDVYKYVKDPNYAKLIDPKLDGPLADAFSTFYKKAADMGISPLKAAITIGFMPYVLDFLFKGKNERKEAAKKAAQEAKARENWKPIELNENQKVFSKFIYGGAN